MAIKDVTPDSNALQSADDSDGTHNCHSQATWRCAPHARAGTTNETAISQNPPLLNNFCQNNRIISGTQRLIRLLDQ